MKLTPEERALRQELKVILFPWAWRDMPKCFQGETQHELSAMHRQKILKIWEEEGLYNAYIAAKANGW